MGLAELHMSDTSRPGAVGDASMSPLLTADDVAMLLAVPRSSVYDYARRLVNPLPSLTIGRHRRFMRGDVERWATAQRTQQRQP